MKRIRGPIARMARMVALSASLSATSAGAMVGRDYWAHEPFPKQSEFLQLSCFEALYGGAAGGGKSDALLMGALEYIHVPGYAALILRRTFADLTLAGAIMDRAKEWLAPHVAAKRIRWNDRDKTFTVEGGGRLQFGYLDTEADKYRYQGGEWQYVGFDELTQFPEAWYRYVISRVRRTKLHHPQLAQLPLRVRAATNPGGIGHEWVRRRFVSPADRSVDVRFVPATLRDNPAIDFDEYQRILERLDPTTRRQLRDGEWVRDSGGLVYHRVDESCDARKAPPQLTATVLGLDFGFVDDTAFVVCGWEEHSRTVYVLESFKASQLTPSDVAERVAELNRQYRFDRIVGDIGGLGKGYVEEARRRFSLPIEAAEKNNKRGYIDLLNGAAANGELRIVMGANDALTAELRELPWRKDRKEEEPGFDNHLCDALLYAWRACTAYTEGPKPKPPTREEWIREEERRIEEALDREVRERQEEQWAA